MQVVIVVIISSNGKNYVEPICLPELAMVKSWTQILLKWQFTIECRISPSRTYHSPTLHIKLQTIPPKLLQFIPSSCNIVMLILDQPPAGCQRKILGVFMHYVHLQFVKGYHGRKVNVFTNLFNFQCWSQSFTHLNFCQKIYIQYLYF